MTPRKHGHQAEIPVDQKIVDIDVESEMQTSFLEYAYSVIYARALPDARDGLKPVQRRILFQMAEMGLRPDRGHVKSARVVGDVMGKLHPHGDAAIYDALVRMAQDFSLRLPLVDGHGNFGSLDDGPAAPRYTEARLAPAALAMTADLDEDTVDFVPNYDNQIQQPSVLPSALPNLLVNGASGIAVGMATNMPPHNLVEVVAAARYLLEHPDATVEDLMRYVPGPDLPGGGKIVGLDGIRDAYATGRGAFRTRATARIENLTAKRKGIIVTELPYQVGPEKVIDKLKDQVQAHRIQGVSTAQDLTDRHHGMRIVIGVKNGFNPEAVLEQLYRLTPMEESFSINNVALVEGQPRTLGLKELLEVYLAHRITVVRRRTGFRLTKAKERAHLVAGLLTAIVDIDEVIQVIRTSDDAAAARDRLMVVFDLDEIQANYILELRLRRLTKFSRLELEAEADELAQRIAQLEEILGSETKLRTVVSDELAEVAQLYGTARRTVLLESAGAQATAAAVPLEVADAACYALLSATGLVARTSDNAPVQRGPERAKHDALVSVVPTSARATLLALTSTGRAVRISCLDLPALPATQGAPSLAGGSPIADFFPLAAGERVIALASQDPEAGPIALGTAQGVVKRVLPEYPAKGDEFEVIALKDGDQVVGAAHAPEESELVFVTTAAQLLHFGASQVRPQGRAAGGMAGIKLGGGDAAIFFGVIRPEDPDPVVVTVAGASQLLAGTQPGSGKVTLFESYPGKGRATGGVRAQRFLKGEDALILAWVGPSPARAVGSAGQTLTLPDIDPRRDGSGTILRAPVHAIG